MVQVAAVVFEYNHESEADIPDLGMFNKLGSPTFLFARELEPRRVTTSVDREPGSVMSGHYSTVDLYYLECCSNSAVITA